MGLRLKYEGLHWRLTGNMRRTVERITRQGTGNLYVIVNYSGLYKMNHILKELEEGQRNGAAGTGLKENHFRSFQSV